MGDITCIIPIYNGEKYIAECIESVLSQTLAISKVIVVNDGSEDNTLKVLEQFSGKIEVINKPHTGISDTLNMGIEAADTEYIAFIDADDTWDPGKTATQMEAIKKNHVDMCFCGVKNFLSPEMTEQEKKMVRLGQPELKGYSKIAMLVQRDVFERVGLFDKKVLTGDFIEWYSRAMSEDVTHYFVDEILCRRRIHLTNMTRSEAYDLKDYTSILRDHLSRMRKKSINTN